ncbi:hypothetical protein [Shewanella baltica]|nr:hypothetical protein [Shewanella baltica]
MPSKNSSDITKRKAEGLRRLQQAYSEAKKNGTLRNAASVS